MTAIIPQPRCSVKVRMAGSADLPFIDQLQKLHTHMVGFFPRKQMEGYLAKGSILIAEQRDEETKRRRQGRKGDIVLNARPARFPGRCHRVPECCSLAPATLSGRVV